MFGSDLDALYFISAEWIYKKFLRAEVMRMSKLVSKIVKFYLRTHERRNWIFKWRKPIKCHISPLPRIWNVLISHCSRTELFILHIYTLYFYCLLSIIYSIWLNYYIMISLPAIFRVLPWLDNLSILTSTPLPLHSKTQDLREKSEKNCHHKASLSKWDCFWNFLSLSGVSQKV